MCIKYSRQVLNTHISKYLHDVFERIGASYSITIVEWEHDKDHVHCLFEAHPKSELTKFINAYKSASSCLIKKEYPIIREKL